MLVLEGRKMKNYKLVSAREREGLSQKQVAESVGITTACYQRYEYGQRLPQVDVAVKISKILNADVSTLFEDEDNKHIGGVNFENKT